MIAPRPSAVRSPSPTTRLSARALLLGLAHEHVGRLRRERSATLLGWCDRHRAALLCGGGRGDHEHRAARALDQPRRDGAQHAAGDAARGWCAPTTIRSASCSSANTSTPRTTGPARCSACTVTPALRIRSATCVGGRLGALGELGARERRERLELEPVEAHDGDLGADLLREVGGGVREPGLVGAGLGGDDDSLHGRPPTRSRVSKTHERSVRDLPYCWSAMPPFKLDAIYSPTADQPAAIDGIAAAVDRRARAA